MEGHFSTGQSPQRAVAPMEEQEQQQEQEECILISLLKTMKCSFTLNKERGLRKFENMVLRRIFGPRTDEVTGKEKTT